MTVQILTVSSPELFVGDESDPRQVLRISVRRADTDGPVRLTVSGEGITGSAYIPAGNGVTTSELGLRIDAGLRARVGSQVDCTVTATSAAGQVSDHGQVTIAEPGWTMVLVSHFHYDPVWWNTQAAYTSSWDLQGADGTTRPVYLHNAFHLVDAHIKLALRDPAYCFVLSEIDYLKPYFDTFPEQRTVLRRLLAEGRVEIIGGTYNEPNTNLTGAETTIRNIVYGVGYQRDILGGDPRNAWQLDVFGHDPQFPGYLAQAGLTGSAWARGPFHQWGPLRKAWGDPKGSPTVMEFPSEFEWISPSGLGVLTHYMPDHYGAGWVMNNAASVEEAGETAYDLFATLKQVAATRNVLLPVGGDYTPPNNWITELHHYWAKTYVWPKFVCGTTADFMNRVRAELADQGRAPSPQSRDMNPIYTGKDVSYIDTKQAQRAAEVAATDAEKLGTFAALLDLGGYPEAALDKAWRQLAFGAHHDGITGSESDQVYIDLVTGWREAHDLPAAARDDALAALAARVDTSGSTPAVVVTNTVACPRTDVVSVSVPDGSAMSVVDDAGNPVPCVVDGAGARRTLSFVAADVPSVGWRTWRLVAGEPSGWQRAEGSTTVRNEFFAVTADPRRGGTVELTDPRTGRALLTGPGNELRVYAEYPQHPQWGEGPWHLLPSGPVVSSADRPATVTVQTCPIGARLISRGEVDGIAYEQLVTVYNGIDRVDFNTRVLDHAQSDRLLRVKFPAGIPGALPVSEVAGAVIGRGFGLIDVDSAEAPWTLDNPANNWFGLGTTARIDLTDRTGATQGTRAIAVAEVVLPDDEDDPLRERARDLVVALARVGVTATTSLAGGARCGSLEVDSNLPDVRILLGGAERNQLTAALADQIGDLAGPVLVPATTTLAAQWRPNADVRDLRALPALVLPDTSAVRQAIEGLAEARITATRCGDGVVEEHRDETVALLTYGLPGFAVDATGALHLSLMRSCTGWPSGIWIDPPRRTAPDGSSFQLQHWTHEFRYALVAGDGDWRRLRLPARGQEFNTPLLAALAEPHGGPLPATASLLSVEPAGDVLVSTVKPVGNPIAHGHATPADPRDGVTVRLIEATGLGRTATVRSWFPITGATDADLLERRGAELAVADGALSVELAGSAVRTMVIDLDVPEPSGPPPAVLGSPGEVAQPSYARYWLHNRGPAQMGYLPVSLSISPTLARTAHQPFKAAVVLANQYGDSAVEGSLEWDLPPGWTADPGHRVFRVEAGGYLRFRALVIPDPDSPPGQYFVAVRVRPSIGGLAGGGAVTAVEDVITVFLGDSEELTSTLGFDMAPTAPVRPEQGTPPDQPGRPTGLTVLPERTEVVVAPGEETTVDLVFENAARSTIRAELALVSPYGTWDWVPRPLMAVEVPARGRLVLPVPVCAPADARPGHAWMLPKVMWFGRAQYAPAVRLEVTE